MRRRPTDRDRRPRYQDIFEGIEPALYVSLAKSPALRRGPRGMQKLGTAAHKRHRRGDRRRAAASGGLIQPPRFAMISSITVDSGMGVCRSIGSVDW